MAMAATALNQTSTELWYRLDAKLQQLAALGQQVPVWWRDDDAVADTPALQRLLDLAADSACPLALAVIPAALEPCLAPALNRHPANSRVLLHGFDHCSRSPAGVRKCEFAAERDLDDIRMALQQGQGRLRAVFDERYRPVLVPPWNRLREDLPGHLADWGIFGLSVLGPAHPHPGLWCHNVHLDLIDWKQRRFAGETRLLAQLLALLDQRMNALAETAPVEPIGLMSHHRDTDEATWQFLTRLLQLLAHAPAITLTDPADLFR